MKKNLLLMISLILVCCGCRAEYNITIGKDLQVTETAIALENAQFYNQYTSSSAQRIISFILEPHLDYFNANNYSISEILGVSEAGVAISRRFDTIGQFKQVSKFSEQFADNWEYIEEGKEITLRIKGAFNDSEQNQDGGYVIDEAMVNIQLPFKVIEHNADNHDEKTNTYSWLLDKPGVESEIYIKFDKTLKNEINPLYFVFGGIIIVIAAFLIWGYNKMKNSENRNEF